jgi:hypothetical protein
MFGRKKGDGGGSVPINLSGLVLLTGVPGAGKTLRMMEYMEAALAAGRPVFACNVDGLKLAGVEEWSDPHKWRELPAGAVLFVDEAQKFFRARRGMVDPPESITAMETIRHDGVCIVMTTQQATYLDKHIRGLVGRHEHLVEVIAGKLSNVYAFRSTREEVTPASLAEAEYKAWAHPTRLHGAYTSAEIHTKRMRLSARAWLMIAGVVFAGGFLAYAFAGPSVIDGEAQASPEAGLAARAVGPQPKHEVSDLEYFARMQPRMEGAPWSAPIYDDVNKVQPPVRIACMLGSTCRCITEQGTRYAISQGRCRLIVREGGIVDPFRPAPEAAGMASPALGGAGGTPAVEGAPAPAPAPEAASGVGSASELQAPYGGFRSQASAPLQTASSS